ncbi:alpha/beta hydrolase [Pelagicoccus sp. SDUM812005]|uniref:alpha/beta hydrolase n=1 Tax=Pelagicoccus sp. SDUM812005 TaxID=3041257 RepID=UPI00281091EB|nr:alpha/beta hydrolase [Pelagicoccus sp. SDUM812005]MDQ8183305.1 alpha/beta hydrolase [Pelagicoccus sp. SDUM812005]
MKYIYVALLFLNSVLPAMAAEEVVEGDHPVIRLWPISLIGGEQNRLNEEVTNRGKIRYHNIKDPNLTVFPVQSTEPTPAVLYCPGGGYVHLTPRSPIIKWLNDQGITVFMLKYTVPDDREAAFRDVQRAMRVVRRDAAKWNVDSSQFGVLGSSAGGHLVARLSQNYLAPAYDAIDDADQLSCEPAFVIIASGAYFATENGGTDLTEEFPMRSKVAPTFLVYAEDDENFVKGGIAYEKALRAAGGSARILLSESGGHGLNGVDWYPECGEWLKNLGLNLKQRAPV